MSAPFLDFANPSFSVASEEVAAARDASWWARTNVGLAVLRYAEVRDLIKDSRLGEGSFGWLAQHDVHQGPLVDWWYQRLESFSGDDGRRLRRLVNPAFTPAAIEPMSTSFRELAEELVLSFAGDGSCEFVSQFARPFSARVLARFLQMPEDDWARLSDWSSDLGLAFGVTVGKELGRIETAIAGLYGVVDALVADRRLNPGDDIVSVLLRAADDGVQLTDFERRVVLSVLVFGGMDTTKDQLGMAIEIFTQHPDQWALLAERPELAEQATEEVLRFNPTSNWVYRVVAEDFEYGGVAFTKGTTVHLLNCTANTDPLVIEPPEFDITQKRPPHFTFGGGMHYCLGHFLARADMREALPVLARAMPDLRLGENAQFRPRSGTTGPERLPVTFSARTPASAAR